MRNILTFLVFFFATFGISVADLDPLMLARTKERVVVVLALRDIDGSPVVSNGTAFFIDSNYAATARHVVLGADKIVLGSDSSVEFEVVADSQDSDVVLMRLSRSIKHFETLAIERKDSTYGETVFSWSLYPQFVDETGRPVHVLNIDNVAAPGIVSPSMAKDMLIGGDILPGASGSPVFNSKGKLLGVLTGVRLGGDASQRWYITVTPAKIVGGMYEVIKELENKIEEE